MQINHNGMKIFNQSPIIHWGGRKISFIQHFFTKYNILDRTYILIFGDQSIEPQP